MNTSPEWSPGKIEWPTLGLILAVYSIWMVWCLTYGILPFWIWAPIGWFLIAGHSSLQHEILHGHPTRLACIDAMLGSVPLSLWLPFEDYRRSHLAHHQEEALTDPLEDPESYYWRTDEWQRLGAIGRLIIIAQSTLLGRLIIGPAFNISRYLLTQTQSVYWGRDNARRTWLIHALYCAPVVFWLTQIGEIPLALYFFGVVYPGAALLSIRSFAEHRATEPGHGKTAIVENAYILGPLFLFNNLHVVHHAHPGRPWYELPKLYHTQKAKFQYMAGNLVYNGYGEIFRRYLFKPHDNPLHPADRMDSHER